ncbi:MAG: fatty acid desaturase, partial [Pseudomonas orientalis]|nr:fatty acid desaturase [Pseudomonas orientalis]
AEMGVRFNDFGTFARANRFERQAQPDSELALSKQ